MWLKTSTPHNSNKMFPSLESRKTCTTSSKESADCEESWGCVLLGCLLYKLWFCFSFPAHRWFYSGAYSYLQTKPMTKVKVQWCFESVKKHLNFFPQQTFGFWWIFHIYQNNLISNPLICIYEMWKSWQKRYLGWILFPWIEGSSENFYAVSSNMESKTFHFALWGNNFEGTCKHITGTPKKISPSLWILVIFLHEPIFSQIYSIVSQSVKNIMEVWFGSWCQALAGHLGNFGCPFCLLKAKLFVIWMECIEGDPENFCAVF